MEQSFLSRRPAVRMVLLLAAGILTAEAFTLPSFVPLFLLVFTILLSGVFALKKSSGVSAPLVLHVSIFLLGFTIQTDSRSRSESAELEPAFEGERVALDGFVDADPVGSGKRARLVVRTDEIQRRGGRERISRRILVETGAERSDLLVTGTHVRVSGRLERLPGPRNPGEFDPVRYFRLRGVSGIVVAEERDGVSVLPGSPRNSIWSVVASLRREFAGVIDSQHDENASAYLKGLLLAERGNIPFEIKQSFVDTGTIHILAVSGLHVVLVALIFYAVFGLFPMPKWLVAALTVLGLIGYMVLTGATASVVRATVMACVVLCGKILQRRTDIYQSLAVSALIILLFDSNQLFDVGFQLSYAAVLSIVLFYPPLEKLIRRIPERFEEIKMLDQGLKLFAVSLAAQLGTIPFTAYYFERISIISLVANLVAVPVSSLNLMIGFTTLAASLVSDWVAGTFAAVNGLLVSFLLGFVGEAARVPFAVVNTAGASETLPFFYYAGLVGVFAANRGHVLKRTFLLIFAGVTFLVFVGLFAEKKNSLSLTVLDVGQGDGILIGLPNGRQLLVDAGPKSLTFDAGQRIVAPYLRRKGIAGLDAVIISHPHSDHLGGVEYLAEKFAITSVYEASERVVSKMHSRLRNTLGSRGIVGKTVRGGERLEFDPDVRLYVLNPAAGHDSSDNLNNRSIVIKIVYGSTSVLLAGDAEEDAEERMMARFGSFLDSDILKVGHHGSSTSSSDAFLDGITPDIAIISVGARNKFHHPSPDILRKLQDRRITLCRTDREGAVIFESNGGRFRRIQWRSLHGQTL